MRFVCAFCVVLSASLVFLGSIDLSLGAIDPINYESVSVLAPCLMALSEIYFKSKRASRGSLVVINLFPHPKSFLQRRMLEALNEEKKHAIGLMVKDARLEHKNASRVTDRAKNYLVLMLELDDLKVTLKQWKSLPTWNPLAQTVIVFMDPMLSVEQKDKEVKGVFEELLSYGIIFANAVYQMESDPNMMVAESWFPYHNKSCARSVENVFKINECKIFESGVEKEIKEFNQNLTKVPIDYHECPFEVSTFIWEPFVVSEKHDRSKVKSGLEVLMLETIAKQMNLELVFTVLKDELLAKEITADNKSGIYADLLQKKADLMMGGLYENHISRTLVSSSITYYQDDITWCVAKAGLAPTWLNVFIIFNITTWIGLLLTLLITSFFLYWFVRYEGNYRENYIWTMLIALALSTGQYGHYWPSKTGIRLFLGTMFFFGLHINTAYHSYLINVLTNPRYDEQISSVERAIGAGLIFNMSENTEVFFGKKEDDVSKYLLAKHQICQNIDECFKEITKDRTKALAISRSHALNNPFGLNENEDFFCFPVSDDVVIYSAVMMFRKFHHLLPIMNDKIRIISESGLLSKWQKDSQMVKNSLNNEKGKGGHGSVQMKLRLEHVEGAFLVVLIGLSIALVTFLLEILNNWLVKNKKSHRISSVLEKYLCHA